MSGMVAEQSRPQPGEQPRRRTDAQLRALARELAALMIVAVGVALAVATCFVAWGPAVGCLALAGALVSVGLLLAAARTPGP